MNIKFFLFIILLLFVLFPLLSVSAATEEFHLIVCATHWNFIGLPPAGQAPSTAFCNICDLLVLVQTGFTFVWEYISIPLGAVMMLYGGFLMVLSSFGRQSASQVTKGRKILLNAVLGLAIVFFAWIGVDSIMKILGAQQTGNFGPWNKIVCTAPTVPVPGTPPPPGPPAPPPPPPAYDGGPKVTETGGRQFLNNNGIDSDHIKPACPPGVQTNCVTVAGARIGTLQTAVDTKNDCKCEVFVTGVAEGGHAGGTLTHGNGDKVDIRRSSQLDAYIQQNYRSAGRRSGDGAALFVNDRTGAVYAKESTHWDVLNGNSWDVDRRTKK